MKRISFLFVTGSLCVSSVLISGCTSLERSHSSGYAYRDADFGSASDRYEAERETSAGELGIFNTRSLTDKEALAVSIRTSLRRAEKGIEGKREREQYYKNKPYMRSDQERLQFLALDSYESRERWLQAKGIEGTSTAHSPEIEALIEVNDITLGMTKQAVRDSWGEPELVEVAGNPLYGNERWMYNEEVSSTEGFQNERRVVYFESGRVAGWEKK